MEKIRVLYITYDGLCDPLGQSQIIPYLKRLANKNIKIVVLSFEKKISLKNTEMIKGIITDLHSYGIEWKILRYHKYPALPATIYDIVSGFLNAVYLVNKNKINILHTRGYIAGIIGFAIRRLLRVKFIFDMRGFWVDEKVDSGFWNKTNIGYKIGKLLEKIMLNTADQVVVLTHKAKMFLKDYIGKVDNVINVIPTCVDLEKFKPLEDAQRKVFQNKIVVLYLGSIGTFYGFEDAVKLFGKLYEKDERFFFLALVNNQKEAAENILKKNNLLPQAHKIIDIPYTEVPNWLRESDISLIFYRRYNSYAGCCPTKFGESLACGVPVIVNKNIGDCDDIVERQQVGFILEDFTDSAYKRMIEQMPLFLRERDGFRHRCRHTAENLFSLESGIKKYLEVYRKAV